MILKNLKCFYSTRIIIKLERKLDRTRDLTRRHGCDCHPYCNYDRMSGVSKFTAERNQRILLDLVTKPGNGPLNFP